MKLSIMFAMIFLFSCDTSVKKINKDLKDENGSILGNELVVNVRQFDEDLNLFLDFYKGMTASEFKEQIKIELKRRRLFYRDLRYYLEKNKKHLNYSSLIDSIDFSLDDSLWGEINFTYYMSNIYFPVNTIYKNYYAEFSGEFDDEGLVSISLHGPWFSVVKDYEKNDIIEVGKNYKKEMVKLYSEKYGNPKITIRSHENKTLSKIISKDMKFDRSVYTFTDTTRNIELKVTCCAEFKTEIKYILKDYNLQKKSRMNYENLIEKKNIKNRKKAKDKTLDEI